jgi:hypothetical protein
MGRAAAAKPSDTGRGQACDTGKDGDGKELHGEIFDYFGKVIGVSW